MTSREQQFRSYLQNVYVTRSGTPMTANTASTYVSLLGRFEKEAHIDVDGMLDDGHGADLYEMARTILSDYGSVVRSYLKFCEWESNGGTCPEVTPVGNVHGAEGSASARQKNHAPSPAASQVKQASWPSFATPTPGDMLKLAKLLTPYAVFLAPRIIERIVADNLSQGWPERLQEKKIACGRYLWDRCPTCYPGVRRRIGTERRGKVATHEVAKKNAFYLDDNRFPYRIWFLNILGRSSINGTMTPPEGCTFAHLFDHQEFNSRNDDELESRAGQEEAHPSYYGLYTSAAGIMLFPKTLVKPTDSCWEIRNLFQRKCVGLYKEVCNVLPPHLAVRRNPNPEWDLENFTWGEPRDSSKDFVDRFLADRNCRIKAFLTANVILPEADDEEENAEEMND